MLLRVLMSGVIPGSTVQSWWVQHFHTQVFVTHCVVYPTVSVLFVVITKHFFTQINLISPWLFSLTPPAYQRFRSQGGGAPSRNLIFPWDGKVMTCIFPMCWHTAATPSGLPDWCDHFSILLGEISHFRQWRRRDLPCTVSWTSISLPPTQFMGNVVSLSGKDHCVTTECPSACCKLLSHDCAL